MQDEVNTKVVAIMIKGGKISARCWARRQSTFTTPQKPVPTTTPTA